jgi:hypothetical protein
VLPAEVTADQVLTIDDPAAAEAWRAQPRYVAVLDQVFNTVVQPLARSFGATARRAFDDPREPLLAYVIDPNANTNLYEAAHAMGAAPSQYGRGGRWRALTSKGYQLRLNTPAEAIALLEHSLDSKATADAEHTAELRRQTEKRMHLEHIGAVVRR